MIDLGKLRRREGSDGFPNASSENNGVCYPQRAGKTHHIGDPSSLKVLSRKISILSYIYRWKGPCSFQILNDTKSIYLSRSYPKL